MRITTCILTAMIFLTSATAFAQGWINYLDIEQGFSVKLPDEPTIEDTTFISQRGDKYPRKVYQADHGESRYIVKVADYTPPPAHLSEVEAVEDVRGAIAWEAWQYRMDVNDAGGEIASDGYTLLGGVEGHRIRITNADQSRTFIAIYLLRRRLYVLEATVPEYAPAPTRFQSSFQMLDQNGEQVRFEIDANGQRREQKPPPLR